MPYRRLPNTDNARLKALECALNKGDTASISDLAVSFHVINEAKTFLPFFKMARERYRQYFSEQVKANRKYQMQIKKARMYVSHFIQVLHFCVIRREMKTESLAFYHLSDSNLSVPNLMSENALMKWGARVIEGETTRIRQGGTPIYNPTIAKVKVHFDIFKESYNNQKNYRSNTSRALSELVALRDKADRIILEIWNQVESSYADLPPKERLKKCKEYGLIYYYRKNEIKE